MYHLGYCLDSILVDNGGTLVGEQLHDVEETGDGIVEDLCTDVRVPWHVEHFN